MRHEHELSRRNMENRAQGSSHLDLSSGDRIHAGKKQQKPTDTCWLTSDFTRQASKACLAFLLGSGMGKFLKCPIEFHMFLLKNIGGFACLFHKMKCEPLCRMLAVRTSWEVGHCILRVIFVVLIKNLILKRD